MKKRVSIEYSGANLEASAIQLLSRQLPNGVLEVIEERALVAASGVITTTLAYVDLPETEYAIREVFGVEDARTFGEAFIVTQKGLDDYSSQIGQELILKTLPSPESNYTRQINVVAHTPDDSFNIVCSDGGVFESYEVGGFYRDFTNIPKEGVTVSISTLSGGGFDLLGLNEFSEILQWSTEMTGEIKCGVINGHFNKMLREVPFVAPPTTNFNDMFVGTLLATDIGCWDVSKVLTMNGMFSGYGQNAVYGSMDLRAWDVEACTSWSDINFDSNLPDSMLPEKLRPQPFTLSGITDAKTVRLSMQLSQDEGDIVVDWGDGSTSTITTAYDDNYIITAEPVEHTYAAITPETKIVITPMAGSAIQVNYMTGFSTVESWGNRAFTALAFAATDSEGMPVENADLTTVPSSAPTLAGNASFMFDNCVAFNSDVSGWGSKLQDVTSFNSMFRNCRSFNQDLSRWLLPRAVSVASMFEGAILFNSPIGEWDMPRVTNANRMFNGAASYSQDMSNWSTQSDPTHVDFATGTLVQRRQHPQWAIPRLPQDDALVLMTWHTSVAIKVQPLGQVVTIDWGDGAVESFEETTVATHTYANSDDMPYLETAIRTDDVEGFSILGVSGYSKVFDWSTKLKGQCSFAPAEGLDAATATVLERVPTVAPPNLTDMSYMFARCSNLYLADLSNWDTSKVTNMSYMFYFRSGMYDAPLGGWKTGNVTDMSYMFYYASRLSTDLSRWDVAKVTNYTSFSVGTNLTKFPAFV